MGRERAEKAPFSFFKNPTSKDNAKNVFATAKTVLHFQCILPESEFNRMFPPSLLASRVSVPDFIIIKMKKLDNELIIHQRR